MVKFDHKIDFERYLAVRRGTQAAVIGSLLFSYLIDSIIVTYDDCNMTGWLYYFPHTFFKIAIVIEFHHRGTEKERII